MASSRYFSSYPDQYMSYHILHQFDEQWFGNSGQQGPTPGDGLSPTRPGLKQLRERARTNPLQHPWVVVAASLIIAACALIFALDARRQAADIQQRLADVESRLKK